MVQLMQKQLSPMEILQLGYKLGFLNDSAVWMLMLKKRNVSVHLYNEDDIDEMILLVHDSFIPAFSALEKNTAGKACRSSCGLGVT